MADVPLLGVLDGAAPTAASCCWSPTSLKARAGAIITLLILANAACLGALALVARTHPKFASPGVLAFTFGLRHAVDADHIAAIDNVSRRRIADGQRPLLVGFWARQARVRGVYDPPGNLLTSFRTVLMLAFDGYLLSSPSF